MTTTEKTKTVINIKIDKELKERARDTAKDIGIPLGTIINAYLRNFVISRHVEFSAPLVPNAKTAKILDDIDKDVKNRKNMSKPFSSVKDAVRYLHS